MTRSTGKLADPAFRRERAAKAARTRTSIDHHIEKVVDAAPDLTASQRDKLAMLFRPTLEVGGSDAA